jgi:hypothetical protein
MEITNNSTTALNPSNAMKERSHDDELLVKLCNYWSVFSL